MCLERLECFGRRLACAYVCEEREMCLWQERKSCMGVCLYREGADVFGGKDGFFIPLFMCKDWAVCLCLLVYNVCVCRNRHTYKCLCVYIDTEIQHGGKDVGEGICVERLVCSCVCHCVWTDWDGIVEGGTGCDYVCE